MPTTFDVIFLGISATDIDPTEGNTTSEGVGLLVGTTWGSAGNPLFQNIQTLRPVSTGTAYGVDNSTSNDRFAVDGQTFTMDGWGVYNATITYGDGTTTLVQVKIAQTTTGQLYLVPHIAGDEAAQAVLDAKPIQSLTLNSLGPQGTAMQADRLASSFADAVVDGTASADRFVAGSTDTQGDRVDAGNNIIESGAGNDTVEGAGGNDTIFGGTGDDLIYGDTAAGSVLGTLNPVNSGNLPDSTAVEASNIRAVELIRLANGELIMISSERAGSTDGISSYQIDNNPSSPTYGQVIGGQIDTITHAASPTGYNEVEDLAAVTLSNGNIFVYSADFNAIGVTAVGQDGSLTALSPITGLTTVGEISIAQVSGQHYLLSLQGGTADRLTAYLINPNGTLTQTDFEVDGSGSGENFLNTGSLTGASLLESFTNSSGQTFVIAGGSENGISLWTLNGSGQLIFQNARGDDAAGAGDTDPQGNGLGRDLVAPSVTGLNGVDAGVFTEIGGQTYLLVGGTDDDVAIFRIDADPLGDGTFDLTLVGHVDNIVTDISAMAVLQTDTGPVLVVGGEQAGLNFYTITVTGGGTVNLTLSATVGDIGAAELLDSEAIAVEGGLLVSASESDDGIAIINTGLNDPAFTGVAGADVISGGAGNDTIFGGAGNDSIQGDGSGSTELITNGNFNTNDLTGWTILNPTGGTAPSTFGGGQVSINWNNEGAGGDGIAQTIPTVAGQTYSFSVDLFESGSGTGNHTIRVNILDAFGTVTDTRTVVVLNGTSETFTFEFVATTNGSTVQITNPSSTNSISTDVILDNVSVIGVTSAVVTGNDVIDAGAGNDTVSGDAGNDSLSGGDGDDLLFGGTGNDTLLLGTGNDTAFGGDGDDLFDDAPGAPAGTGNNLIDGGAGNDFSWDGSGNDTFFGGDGNDTFIGDSGGDDLLFGQAGDDRLEGGLGSDTLDGGDGADALFGGDGNDLLGGGAGNDRLEGGLGNDTLDGGDGADTLLGGSGNDLLITGGNDINDRPNLLDGGAGDDTLRVTGAFNGDDTLIGGDGIDELQLLPDNDRNMTVSMPGGFVVDGTIGTHSFSGIENVTTAAGNDSILGDAQNNVLSSGAGNDTLNGGAGNDTLLGGLGSDRFVLTNGFGIDSIVGGEDPSGTDIDVLDASGITAAGVNVALSSSEAGTLTSGSNSATFQNIESFVLTAQADLLDATAAAGPVRVDAGGGHDIIFGGTGADTILGGAGDDFIRGGAGNDSVDAGDGDDFVQGGAGADTLDGGAGLFDELTYVNSSAAVSVNLETGAATGGDAEGDVVSNFEMLSGSAFDDTLTGSAADDLLFGLNGNDIISGGAGADFLSGGADNDTLNGGADNDILDGGAGNDVLTGGLGNDIFIVSGGHDTVADFNTGTTGTLNDGDPTNNDRIDLSGHYDSLFELWADQADDGVLNQSNTVDSRGNAVDYSNNTQFGPTGSLTFTGAIGNANFFNAENTGVICFAEGTMIHTSEGEIAVETLVAGDRVMTQDSGLQPILWIGKSEVACSPKLAPIRIERGALGHGLPTRPLYVSPQHRILLRSRIVARMIDCPEALVAAKFLLGLPGITQDTQMDRVKYFHILCPQHEIVFANGAPAETLLPGPQARFAMGPEAWAELLAIFPDITDTLATYPPARTILRGDRSRNLGWRHVRNAVALVNDWK